MHFNRPLRRSDKKISDRIVIEEILQKAEVCRIAMCYKDEPYIVPVNFGFENNTLYFHSFNKGLKIDILEKNSRVCFEVDIETSPIPAEKACDWGFRYKSVIGRGKAVKIEDKAEKLMALLAIIRHYSEGDHEISEKDIERVTLFKITAEHLTGKQAE